MEDELEVVELDSYRFFAVYDGHGGSGVANMCRDRLHQLLEKEVAGRVSGSPGWGALELEKVMNNCFRKMDEEIGRGRAVVEDEGGDGGGGGGREVALNTVGFTAVVVIVGKALVVVANRGDSRAVLCHDGAFAHLSLDHKPDRSDEKERVEAAGGRIINWNGSRVPGVLATSRSIAYDRTELDQFIVIASDGRWDVVSNEFACEVVKRCFNGQIRRRFSEGLSGNSSAEAAALLAELAMARGSKDNISVVVVDLKK